MPSLATHFSNAVDHLQKKRSHFWDSGVVMVQVFAVLSLIWLCALWSPFQPTPAPAPALQDLSQAKKGCVKRGVKTP